MTRRSKWVLTVTTALAVLAAVGVGALLVHAYDHYASVVRYDTHDGVLRVETGQVQGIGTALVTNRGYALYMFPPDDRHGVSCTDKCADAWPPLSAPGGTRVVAGDGVEPALLGTVRQPGGGRVVTYHGWPLYTYFGDDTPLQATGQAVDADGGYWYLLRPSGHIITRSPR